MKKMPESNFVPCLAISMSMHMGSRRLGEVCAGNYNLAATLAVVYYCGFYRKSVNLAWIYDQFLPLMTAAILFSLLLSIVLYFASHRRSAHPPVCHTAAIVLIAHCQLVLMMLLCLGE